MRPLVILATLGLLSGCGTAPRSAARAPHGGSEAKASEATLAANDGGCWQGNVTYYADDLAGNRTASGERYEPGKMTAAHRSLPFGTWLRVSWQGREVRVRVNDRGGPRGGVDLSRAAASELAMLRAGRVRGHICSER